MKTQYFKVVMLALFLFFYESLNAYGYTVVRESFSIDIPDEWIVKEGGDEGKPIIGFISPMLDDKRTGLVI